MVVLWVLTICGCSEKTTYVPNNTSNSIVTIIQKKEVSSLTSTDLEMKKEELNEMFDVSVSIEDKEFLAKFHDNTSAKAIVAEMPLTIKMNDFSGQEKVVPLTFDLPKASIYTPSSINVGEIYLWSGNQLVLFYTFLPSNDYRYTPIGYIEDVEGLTEALGSGNVTITLKLE